MPSPETPSMPETASPIQAFDALTLARLRLTLTAQEPARLPEFLGSTLRGALASAMRAIVCPDPNKTCGSCAHKQRCLYSLLFETPLPDEAACLRAQDRVPHPLVLVPPMGLGPVFAAGDPLPFSLLLLGSGPHTLDPVPYLVAAAEAAARRGLGRDRRAFQLVSVHADLDGPLCPDSPPGPVLWRPNGFPPLLPPPTCTLRHLVENSPAPESTLHIQVLTPLRLLSKKRLITRPSFRDLARALLARISSLLAFHGHPLLGNRILTLDYRGLLDRAAQVRTLESRVEVMRLDRWSNRQRRAIPLDGILGELRFEGEAIRELWPFLQAGQHLHVGKGTIFGLGQYRMQPPHGSSDPGKRSQVRAGQARKEEQGIEADADEGSRRA